MKKIAYLIFILGFSLNSIAAFVDTVSIFSNSMHKPIKCVVIKPNSYKTKSNRFPVVYLLHGYGGNYSSWINKVPQLMKHADTYQMIIVCPDGNYSSWYLDSPVDTTFKYETHIAREVIHYIDKNLKTIADKNHRAITGLSMGGYGALFIALRHADVFGGAGSMSGGVDLEELKTRFDVIKRVGDTITNTKNWHDLSIINLIEKYINTPLKIIFDCGNKDLFVEANKRLHERMLQLKIPHDYIERPGEHNWKYWQNAVSYQLLFFYNFFNSYNTPLNP